MKKEKLIFKINREMFSLILFFLLVLCLSFLVGFWKLSYKIIVSSICVLFLLLWVYEQICTSVYYLYEDKLIIRFPFRLFYNKYEFFIKDIQSITFYDIKTVGVHSSIIIYCKNKNKQKYRLIYTNTSDKMRYLLNILKKKNVFIKIANISGWGKITE